MLVLCFLYVTIPTIVRSTGIGVWNNVTETRAKPFERMHQCSCRHLEVSP